MGRSRPNCLRIASMSAWLAPGSTRSTVGSPVSRTRRKIVTDRSTSEIAAKPTPLALFRFMSFLPQLQVLVRRRVRVIGHEPQPVHLEAGAHSVEAGGLDHRPEHDLLVDELLGPVEGLLA